MNAMSLRVTICNLLGYRVLVRFCLFWCKQRFADLQLKSGSGNFVEQELNKKIHPARNWSWELFSCCVSYLIATSGTLQGGVLLRGFERRSPLGKLARIWPTGMKSSIISEGTEISCKLNLLSKRLKLLHKLPGVLEERLHAGSGSSLSQRRQKEAGGQDAERHVAGHHAWRE